MQAYVALVRIACFAAIPFQTACSSGAGVATGNGSSRQNPETSERDDLRNENGTTGLQPGTIATGRGPSGPTAGAARGGSITPGATYTGTGQNGISESRRTNPEIEVVIDGRIDAGTRDSHNNDGDDALQIDAGN